MQTLFVHSLHPMEKEEARGHLKISRAEILNRSSFEDSGETSPFQHRYKSVSFSRQAEKELKGAQRRMERMSIDDEPAEGLFVQRSGYYRSELGESRY